MPAARRSTTVARGAPIRQRALLSRVTADPRTCRASVARGAVRPKRDRLAQRLGCGLRRHAQLLRQRPARDLVVTQRRGPLPHGREATA